MRVKAPAADRTVAAARHLAHRAGCAAAKQDAVGALGPGRHHCRGCGHRHDGDRSRLESHLAERHRQHGGQHVDDLCRDHRHRRRESGDGQRDDAHAPGRHRDCAQCPAVSGVAPIVRARSQIVYGNRNWVPEQISGTTPSFSGGTRLAEHGQMAKCSPTAMSATATRCV